MVLAISMLLAEDLTSGGDENCPGQLKISLLWGHTHTHMACPLHVQEKQEEKIRSAEASLLHWFMILI